MGVEPTSQAWKASIIAVIRQPQIYSCNIDKSIYLQPIASSSGWRIIKESNFFEVTLIYNNEYRTKINVPLIRIELICQPINLSTPYESEGIQRYDQSRRLSRNLLLQLQVCQCQSIKIYFHQLIILMNCISLIAKLLSSKMTSHFFRSS